MTASSLLVGHTDWPAVKQVFQLTRRTLMGDGTWRAHVVYGVTSLPTSVADAQRLLVLARGHWGIENGLFYRRGCPLGRVTLGEDRCLLRRGHGPQVFATLNDLTLGILLRAGHTNVAAARRISAAFPDHTFHLLTAA